MNTQATITGISTEYDGDSSKHLVKVVGTGFTTDTIGVEMFIDGMAQKIKTSTKTLLTFEIVEVKSYKLKNIKIYLQEGVPKGMSVVDNAKLELTPQFLGLVPDPSCSL